jgi:hypothetical protein
MMLVPAVLFVKLTPGLQDDVAVYGIIIIKEVGKFVLVASAAWLTGEGIIYLQSHSNPAHNPNIKGSPAITRTKTVMALIAAGTSGCGVDPQKCKCGVIKVSGIVTRAAIWIADASLPEGGFMTWFFKNQPGTPMMGPWGGSYPKSITDFDSYQPGKTEIAKGWTWEPKDCNDNSDGGFPKPPNFLQPAQ